MQDTDTFDPILVLSRLVRRYAFQFATSSACVLLMNPGESHLTIEYAMGVMEPYAGRIIQATDGVAGLVLTSHAPHFISDYLHWTNQYQRLTVDTREQIRAVAGTPVFRNGAVWAILSFVWKSPNPAPDADIMATLSEISTAATDLIARMDSTFDPLPFASPPLNAPGYASVL